MGSRFLKYSSFVKTENRNYPSTGSALPHRKVCRHAREDAGLSSNVWMTTITLLVVTIGEAFIELVSIDFFANRINYDEG